MRNILELRAEQFTEAVTGPDAFAVISHCSQVPQCHCKQVIITNPRTGNPKFPQLCPASAGESMRAGLEDDEEGACGGKQAAVACA